MQQKNYKNLFKAEKEMYELVSYEHKLENIEEAFILRHKASKSA